MNRSTEAKRIREVRESYHIGPCEKCGKLRFQTKKAAKEFVKRTKDYSMKAYRCGEFFHIGHQPERLRRGKITRSQLRSNKRKTT